MSAFPALAAAARVVAAADDAAQAEAQCCRLVWTSAEHLADQRREETVTVAANEAGNAAAVRVERLMSEHDQQLQIVREDHAQEVSHLQHLAAAAAAGRQMIMMTSCCLLLFLETSFVYHWEDT